MHRKRVTCELHDSCFRLMTIKHAIPKIEWAIALLYMCIHIHNDTIIKTSEDFLKKIYLSLYCKDCVWEGVGDWTKTATYWPHQPLWTFVFLVLLDSCSTGGPEAHSVRCGFLYCILSPTCLQTQSGIPKAPSARWWLSQPHLVSNSLDFQLYRGSRGPLLLSGGFLYHTLTLTSQSSPSYIIVQWPTQSLEWHVWSSSSRNNGHAVHRSLSSGASVYECTMGFYLVPYYQQSPPTRFLLTTAIGMCHFLLVHHFGMACLAGSKVNIWHYSQIRKVLIF